MLMNLIRNKQKFKTYLLFPVQLYNTRHNTLLIIQGNGGDGSAHVIEKSWIIQNIYFIVP
jgi:hypothetical protein